MLPIVFLFHQAQISPFHPHHSNTQKMLAYQVQTCHKKKKKKQFQPLRMNPNIYAEIQLYVHMLVYMYVSMDMFV